jgi:RNA polymerase sigma-70 factor (ECF subfamily)
VTNIDVANARLTQDFEAIFREHYSLIYRTAYSVTGSSQDAEDVLQDLFLWLIRKGIPPDIRDIKAYLYRAAVNASLTIVKSRRREISHDEAERGKLQVVAGVNSDAEGDSAERALLMASIAQLDPRSVEMLILRYEHDYSDAAIAKLLGTSRGVVAVALHRARARLKKIIRASSAGRIHDS